MTQHKHHESQHQTLHSLWGAQTRRNQASWLIVYSNETHLSFFADQHLRPRVKGRPFHSTMHNGGAVVDTGSSPPSPLLPPPAGWVRCKAHHHPPLRVHQVASGGTATLDYSRYRGLPSHLVLHPQRTTSQGAVPCEIITLSA